MSVKSVIANSNERPHETRGASLLGLANEVPLRRLERRHLPPEGSALSN